MTTTQEVALRIRWRTNIRSHITWFEYLDSGSFFADIKRRYESSSNLAELQAIARQVIEEEIYSYANYQGDGKIAESITPTADGPSESANASIFFDPHKAPAKGPVSSGIPGQYNYAAFFDDPNFNSFLPPGAGLEVRHPRKYRPFSEPLLDAGNEFATRQSMKAILLAIKKKIPRKQTND